MNLMLKHYRISAAYEQSYNSRSKAPTCFLPLCLYLLTTTVSKHSLTLQAIAVLNDPTKLGQNRQLITPQLGLLEKCTPILDIRYDNVTLI
jgi:hypothetical protein